MISELPVDKYGLIIPLGKLIKNSFSLIDIGPNDKVIVYEQDKKVIGFLTYSQMYEIVDILYIAVDKKYQRQKLGQKLINYLTRLPNTQKIMLEVRVSNVSALEFYKSSGFTILREIKNYYGKESALAMERKIL